jgi:uncharacterized repeat protein (TIGR02543 family)
MMIVVFLVWSINLLTFRKFNLKKHKNDSTDNRLYFYFYISKRFLSYNFFLGGGMKKYLFRLAVLVFTAAVIGCSGSKTGHDPVTSASDLTLPTVSEMKEGMYLGGGLLYSSTNPAYNHFNGFNVIPVRLSKLKETTKTGEIIVKTYDPDTGALVSQSTTDSMGQTEEIADSLLVGQIGIKTIDDNAVTIAYKLLNGAGETAYVSDNTAIALGTKCDLNGDGIGDLEYAELDPENLGGLKGVKILRFLSDESALTVTMYRSPSDSTYKYPSGILAVNPSDNFVFKLSSLTYLEGADVTTNGKKYRVMTFESSSVAAVSQYNFIFDDAAAKMYIVTLAPETKNGKTVFYCTLYDTFMAFEHVNFKYAGTSDKLMMSNNKLRTASENLSSTNIGYLKKLLFAIAGVPQNSFEVPLSGPALSFSREFYRSGADSLSVSIENKNSLYVDADYGFHGTSASVNCTILFKGNISMLMNGRLSGTSDGNYPVRSADFSQAFDAITIPVTIGPVYVGNFVLPVEFGAKVSAQGYGTMKTGASLSGKFGFTGEVGVEVKYKKIKVGFIKIKIPYGIGMFADGSRICDVSADNVRDIAFRGSINFTPYMSMGGGFRLFGIAGADIYTKASFENVLSTQLEYGNSSNLSVNYKLDGKLSVGAQLVAELEIMGFGGSTSRKLGEIPVWENTIFNQTFTIGGGNNPYNIRYNSSGASGSVPQNSVYIKGETVTMPANTTGLAKSNYALKGWKINNLGPTYAAGESFSMPASDITMYADWVELPKYTVSYNLNGGTGTTPYSAVYYEGAEVQTAAAADYGVQRTAWKFLGWSTSPDGSVIASTFKLYKDVTLYAVWGKIPEHKVIYDSNGMTVGSLPAPEYKYEGETFYPLDPPDPANKPVKTGYYFGGWSETPGGTKIESGITMGTSDKTLYVYWSANPSFTVKFYLYDTCLSSDLAGSYFLQSGVSSIPLQVDNQQAITDNRRISDGYEFAGWKCVTDANYKCGDTMPGKGLVFVAQWNKLTRYTVTFYSNGGNGSPVGMSIECWIGKKVNMPTDIPSLYHYDFTTWTDNLGATHSAGSSFDYTSGSLTSMTAQWSYHYYDRQLIFNGKGAYSNSYPTVSVTVKGNDVITLPHSDSKGFSKQYYHFAGWGDENLIKYGNQITMPDSDLTVFAIWDANAGLSYNGNGHSGGTVPATYILQYNTATSVKVAIPGDLCRDDSLYFYSFAGWNTSPDGSGSYYYPGDTIDISSTSVCLYAMWTPAHKFWVIYDANGGTATISNSSDRFAYRAGDTVTVKGNYLGYYQSYNGYDYGWSCWISGSYVDPAGDGHLITVQEGDTFVMPSENVILKAYYSSSGGPDSGN